MKTTPRSSNVKRESGLLFLVKANTGKRMVNRNRFDNTFTFYVVDHGEWWLQPTLLPALNAQSVMSIGYRLSLFTCE